MIRDTPGVITNCNVLLLPCKVHKNSINWFLNNNMAAVSSHPNSSYYTCVFFLIQCDGLAIASLCGNHYFACFQPRLVPLSKALYHTCFICGQRCKYWSRRPKLTSSVISDVKHIIYILLFGYIVYFKVNSFSVWKTVSIQGGVLPDMAMFSNEAAAHTIRWSYITTKLREQWETWEFTEARAVPDSDQVRDVTEWTVHRHVDSSLQ